MAAEKEESGSGTVTLLPSVLFVVLLLLWLFPHAGSPLQELLVLPTVCDLFSCLKVGGDKDKWLHRAAEPVSWFLLSDAATALTCPG